MHRGTCPSACCTRRSHGREHTRVDTTHNEEQCTEVPRPLAPSPNLCAGAVIFSPPPDQSSGARPRPAEWDKPTFWSLLYITCVLTTQLARFLKTTTPPNSTAVNTHASSGSNIKHSPFQCLSLRHSILPPPISPESSGAAIGQPSVSRTDGTDRHMPCTHRNTLQHKNTYFHTYTHTSQPHTATDIDEAHTPKYTEMTDN